jgi:uncharacterized caspase-like protein
MRKYLLFLLLLGCYVSCTVRTTHAAETRGLSVVAKDQITNQSGEVKLYNKSYAVIIGIDRYPNLPQDRQLSYAVKDAQGVEQILKRQYRFDKVFTLYDQQATKERIQELLTEELPGQMGEDDALFIFWAGHGNQEKKSEGDLGYLVPYDGSIGKLRTVITMDEIKNTVSKAIPAKHVFYVFDACYSGLLTTRAVDNKSRRDLAYLKEITRERVRQVLTAGGKGQQVLDSGRNGHSVFTGRLIEILEAKGDFVTANEIQAIIREKVSGDARARGYNQTPAFDAISGSGDFVFIPNIEQKVQDSKAELARMEAELKDLELSALQAKDDQKKQEVERQKRVIEARIKAEELKKTQLAEDQSRIQQDEQKRAALEASNKEDEAKLAKIKAELERKKQQQPVIKTNSIEAAVAEIQRMNGQIAELDKNAAPARTEIIARYDKKIAELNAQQQGEFEKERDFRARIQKESGLLESRKQSELAQLAVESIALREEVKRLSEKVYTLDGSQIEIELGKYDVEKELFPVTLKNKPTASVVLAVNGSIPLPLQQARAFKQQYESGLVRPKIQARPNGEIVTAALANDAEDSLLEYANGGFMTAAESNRRLELARIAGFSVEGDVVKDIKTGLMWARNGNIANKDITWDNAMIWVKQLKYGGYRDWRLPTKEEFSFFAKRSVGRPYEWFNAIGFYNVQAHSYWSSSTVPGWPGSAEGVYMVDGIVYSNAKPFNEFVWPVRNLH